jgi:hypothetical protein
MDAHQDHCNKKSPANHASLASKHQENELLPPNLLGNLTVSRRKSSPSTSASECSTIEDAMETQIKTKDGIFILSPHLTSTSLALETINLVYNKSFAILPDEIQLFDKLGEGQFGIVHEGTYRGRPCAVKMLKHGVHRDSVQYERLLLELAVLAGVGRHPNLVGFIGACVDDLSCPLIVEELIQGPNLDEYLSSKPKGFNLGQPLVSAAARALCER